MNIHKCYTVHMETHEHRRDSGVYQVRPVTVSGLVELGGVGGTCRSIVRQGDVEEGQGGVPGAINREVAGCL